MTSKKNLEYQLAMVTAERDFYKVTANSWQDLYHRAIESHENLREELTSELELWAAMCAKLMPKAMGDE